MNKNTRFVIKTFLLLMVGWLIGWALDVHAAESVQTKMVHVQEWFERQNYIEKSMTDDQFMALLTQVNQKVNKQRYQSDKVDYWKTPDEFYADHGGDCEDYVIAKIDALARRGIALSDMEILIVKRNNIFSHALLGVKRGGGRIILDNQNDLPYSTLGAEYRIVYRISFRREANRIYTQYSELEQLMPFATMRF